MPKTNLNMMEENIIINNPNHYKLNDIYLILTLVNLNS